jgi:hypothetical protein
MIRRRLFRCLAACSFAAAACIILPGALAAVAAPQTGKPADGSWQALFDGKTLTNWQPTKFIGEGSVTVADGQIVLARGGDLTGITWSGPALPTTNYELSLQAMRVEGNDFFAGITFPVADSHCSLILGGWGGTMVGLSSINGMDASENETSQSIIFEAKRWYDVRIRVTTAKIEVWLDEKPIISQELARNTVDIRIEMFPSRPLGIASWRTTGAVRGIKLRRL